MTCGRRFSLCPLAVALFATAALASASAHAAVTTYTGTFAGTIAAGNTALLTGTASVSGNVANSGTLQFNVSGSSAVANNAIISGTGIVRMTGSGTVSNLFDAQTYTGATRLENGTLLINYNDRLGNTSSGVVFDGGELQITNSGVVSTFSTARSMSLVSAGTIDTSTLADGSYDQPAFTGVVSGTGTLTLAAHGLGDGATDAYLRFGGASTYTGTTLITSGVVYASSTTAFGSSTVFLDGGSLGAPAAVTVNNAIVLAGTANSVRAWSSQTMNLGGVISGTGGLQKTDNGTVNLNSANSYTGDTKLTAGTIRAGNDAAFGDSANALLLNGGTVSSNSSTARSFAQGVTIGGNAAFGDGTNAGALTFSGAVGMDGGTRTVTTVVTTTFSGAVTNGNLTKAGAATLALTNASNNFGTLTVNAGTVSIGANTAITSLTGSGGALNLSAGTLTLTPAASGTVALPFSGSGGFTKAGSNTLWLTGNSSTYAGGTQLQAGTLALGSAGAIGSSGTISFTGGTLQYSASNTTDYSARFSTAAGQDYAIDTNGQNVTYATWLQSVGGSLTKSGEGTLSLTGWANFPGSDQRYVGYDGMDINVMSGTLSVFNYVMLVGGTTGGASLNVSGGVAVGNITTPTGLAYAAGSSGTATVTGGVLRSSVVRTDYFGNGVLDVSGGEVLAPVLAGTNPGSSGTVLLSGGTLGTPTNLHTVGSDGAGSLTMNGGSLVGALRLGAFAGSQGTAAISGGTATLVSLTVAQSGTGQLSLTDAGSVTWANGTGTLDVGRFAGSVGVLNIGTGGAAGALATGTVTGGSGAATVNFNHAGTTTFSSALTGTMTVNKLGAGTTNLTGVSTFTGTATVSTGQFAVNGSLGAASLVNVLSGGALSGTGTIAGATTIAGVHAPGNSPGVQTFTSDLTYLVGAAVEWELAANTASGAGTNFDQVAMPTGNLTFSGSTTLALSFNGAGSTVVWSDTFWDSNRAWVIYDLGTGTTTGLSNLVVGGSLLDSLGNALLASRGAFSTSLVGQDVFLNYTVAAVPEPATVALALAGLAGGGCVLRRRRRA